LPRLARHANDERGYGILNSANGSPPDSDGTIYTFSTLTEEERRDFFCHVQDAVVVSMCKLAGKKTADFGFPAFPETKYPDGQPMSLVMAIGVGFKSKAERAEAFKKAAAWLKTFEPHPTGVRP
jgi:hypothetical protein